MSYISNFEQFIFIHIPKCAGTSMEILIGTNTSHESINVIKNRLSENKFNKYYKFSFVRNPWDRAVSFYEFIKKIKEKEPKRKLTNKKQIYKKINLESFKGFCKDLATYSIEDPRIARRDVSRYSRDKNLISSVFAPMYQFLTDKNDNLLMNFVGKFENINEDWKKICKELYFMESLPKKRVTPHKNYKEYYDNKSIEFIRKWASKDIEMFEYSY